MNHSRSNDRNPADSTAFYAPTTSGMAVASFITSFFCGLIGLVLAIIALSEISGSEGRLRGQGWAIGGMVISLGSIFLAIMLKAGG